MDQAKLDFISKEAFRKLEALHRDSPASWGVMNAQEMVEHLADFFDVSTGKIRMKLHTPEEHLPKYLEFLMSDKEFRENTKAPAEVLGEKPMPLRLGSLDAAKENLQSSVEAFSNYFSEDEMKRTIHPVFGNLNYDEWVRLHYKHVMHHLKQFNLADK